MKEHLQSTIPTASGPSVARVYKSESAHWYTKAGEACHVQPLKDGTGTTPTTLRHARKLGLLPSVTTVIGILDKPALTSWLIENAVMAVLTAQRRDGEQTDAFVKRVLQDEKQQDQESRKAMDNGTRVHAALEDVCKARMEGRPEQIMPDMRPWIEPVLALGLLKGRIVATEQRVVGDGYAGTYDLEVEQDEWLNLIDFKTAKSIPKSEPWTEHKLQLSAYAKAKGNTGGKRIRTWNIYISNVSAGVVQPYECFDWEKTYEQGFKPLVKFWQWRNDYIP